MTPIFRRSGAVAALAASTFVAPGVFAQSDEQRAAARSLAFEGAKACDESRWQDCADLFQRAESLVHAPTHLLYQARAQEKLGHIVRAHELYLKIAREQLADNAPVAFRNAQATATDAARQLEPKIGHLTIKVVGGDPSAVTVTFDGETVPAALIGVSRPVDPGDHSVEAKGATFAAPPQTAKIAEGGHETVSLELTAVAASTTEPAATERTAAAPPTESAPVDTGKGDGKQTLKIASYAALGVGVVGVAVGTIFALKSKSNRSDADSLYDQKCKPQCLTGDPAAQQVASLDDSARSAQTLSIVGFAVGGVGLATGVTLFFLSRGHEPSGSTTGARWSPWVGLGSAGVAGKF